MRVVAVACDAFACISGAGAIPIATRGPFALTFLPAGAIPATPTATPDATRAGTIPIPTRGPSTLLAPITAIPASVAVIAVAVAINVPVSLPAIHTTGLLGLDNLIQQSK